MTDETPKQVFLVEDDPYIADIILDELKTRNYLPIHARNGEEALEMIEEGKIDACSIVLLDLLLPKVHGFEVLNTIKARKETSAVPVLILSNLGDEQNIEKGKQLGAAAYLVKANHTPREIVAKMQDVIAESA